MDVSHIVAKTHTAEYGIHKYWSRKPHNVLRELFGALLTGKERPTFVDPFCGSGVTLAEARRLGADVFGSDLNPIGALLSSVTCSPADPVKVSDCLDQLSSEFAAVFGNDYVTALREELRYVVHATLVKCKCGGLWTQAETRKDGRTYACPSCATRLSFNLRHKVATRVLQVRTNRRILELSDNGEGQTECLRQQHLAYVSRDGIDSTMYDAPMLPNGRVLAFPGMTTSDLFTPRAFSAACWLFSRAEQIEDESVRQVCLVFLTSTVAQFSRLIPYRNDLTTGGPAWTVPGFWAAPIHLETNPVVHLRARKRKFLAGLQRLWLHNNWQVKAAVRCADAVDFLSELSVAGDRADLIFFDPPYGDSVPYLEFSAMWNAMLRERGRYDREVVISNRTEFPSGWEEYSSRLAVVIRKCRDVLKPDGKILVTFNNLEYRTWHAIARSMKDAGLACHRVHYQVPAVVSAKAQFSPENSYQGDFYCVFGVPEEAGRASCGNESHEIVRNAVLRVLKARKGRAPAVLVQRAAILAILRENLDPDFILKVEQFIAGFTRRDEQGYVLLAGQGDDLSVPDLRDVICETAMKSLTNTHLEWDELFKHVLDATEPYGVPSEREARESLSALLDFGPPCRLRSKIEQGVLFA